MAELPRLKRQPEKAFLQECDSQALQQTLRDLDRAFINFFEKRARYPRRKSRKRTAHAFHIPQRVAVAGNHVRIPKTGLVRISLHREMEGVLKSATVKQDATGRWHVAFVCHFEPEEVPATAERPAGVDVGLETFAAFDDGCKVPPPRFYRQQERRLQRLQRCLSRCQKGSRNRSKARKRPAVAHTRVRQQRQNWLHQLSFTIVHADDTVCLEDLNVKGLAKTKRGAKLWSDAAPGTFTRMLAYKGRWYGCQVIRVDRFFASTKSCHACGHRQELALSERRWICAGCHSEHDRETNAARNLLAEGLRRLAAGHVESLNAGGEGVRLATASVPR